MKIDIRKSFVKDADKLPAPFQKQLAVFITATERAQSPHQIPDCKKMSGHKTARHIGLMPIVIHFRNQLVFPYCFS